MARERTNPSRLSIVISNVGIQFFPYFHLNTGRSAKYRWSRMEYPSVAAAAMILLADSLICASRSTSSRFTDVVFRTMR